MPSPYEFVVFSDVQGMRNRDAKRQIRKHAMREIGKSRRSQRPGAIKYELDIRQPCADPAKDQQQAQSAQGRTLCPARTPPPMSRPGTLVPTSVTMDHTTYELLQYFVFYSTRFPNNFTFTPDITSVMNAVLSDDLMVNCVLGAAASRFCYVQDSPPSPIRARGLHCTQRSLRLLRARLDKGASPLAEPTEPAVDCVLYLAAAALYNEEWETAEVHVKAAVALIQRAGGLSVLGEARVLVRLLSLDDVLACRRCQPCLLDRSYDTALWDCASFRTMHLSSTGYHASAVSLLANDQWRLSAPLKAMVKKVQECDRVRDLLEEGSEIVESMQIPRLRHWRTLRSLAIRNELLALETSDPKEETLRLVLIMWTLLPPNDLRQTLAAQAIAARLQPLLRHQDAVIWKGLQEVRLWCLIIGVFASDAESDCRRWFLSESRSILLQTDMMGLNLETVTVQNLVDVQKRFLYRQWVLDKLTKPLVDMLCSEHSLLRSTPG